MKKLLLLGAIALLFGFSTDTLAQGRYNRSGRINDRADRRTIRQGIRSGQITRDEARQLRERQRQIREERRAYRSDGTLTREERREIRRDEREHDRERADHEPRRSDARPTGAGCAASSQVEVEATPGPAETLRRTSTRSRARSPSARALDAAPHGPTPTHPGLERSRR